MVVVAVRVRVKPAKREELIRMAQQMLTLSREEKGCISYNFFADTVDANAFLYFEEWESHSALKAHGQTEHYGRYSKALPDVLERPSEIRVYDVSKVELR
jgi:quinol monooxygenase YgiN